MVIGNDHVNSQTVCVTLFFHISDAAINGYEKSCAILSKFFYRFTIEALPFGMSMGNIVFKIFISDLFEKVVENDRAGNSIAIIIAIHNYFFLMVDRRKNTPHRFLHVEIYKS